MGRALVLGKHPVHYFECGDCGFIGTTEPHWLDEAYQAAITDTDLGLVSRSLSMAKFAAQVMALFLDPRDRILDFGGGYGITVRLLRDLGFDAWWQDEFCENLFGRGFAAPSDPEEKFPLATAFEVAEHLPDPMATFRRIFERSDSLLFSTELIPDPHPQLGEWDYYAPEHGQHIAFYSRKTLETLATTFDKRLYSNGRTLHLLTPHSLPAPLVKLALTRRLPWPVLHQVAKFRAPGFHSRLKEDHRATLKRLPRLDPS